MVAANGRLRKELNEVGKVDKSSGVSAAAAGDGSDLRHLKGKINGPESTCYEGGIFEIDIRIPKQYPFEPPKMKFTTKIWHPNISSQTGAICLDILKDQWSPALTIKTALLSLRALLSSPEPNDPQDAEVAKMYINDRKKFEKTAKFWTESYGKEVNYDAMIKGLEDMGFDKASAKKALEKHDWDESRAVNELLGM
jgi:ubiquitin-conjugating enzyme (huntingtin interacting protein 2)